MGELAKPVLPPYLYRYRRLPDDARVEQEIVAIKEKYLWCSTYKGMNDPMEGLYEATARFQKDSIYRRAVADILYAKLDIGICCFSDTYDNELMWTHYAGDHSGICIGYQPALLVEGLPTNAQLVRVAYGMSPPAINAKDAVNATAATCKILSHKKSSWQYEREWRVLGLPGRVDIKTKGCVRELHFGPNVNPLYKDRMMNKLRSEPIRIYQMELEGYGHKRTKLKSVKPMPPTSPHTRPPP
jgi:Protein of unknown function (DUF2971)